jgi:hypothetical protein
MSLLEVVTVEGKVSYGEFIGEGRRDFMVILWRREAKELTE